MAANEYHFITRWRVRGTAEEVSDIIADPVSLALWWPAVYLDVRELSPGGDSGVGRVVALHTRGWLPYTLRWQFRVTESDLPQRIALEAWGDFDGRGIWTFAQDGEDVDVTYDWELRAEKPLLRWGSPLFKPFFAANHRWAMARGAESLRLEVARRAATNEDERSKVPPPPQPPRTRGVLLAVVVGAIATGAILWMLRRR